jgi:hypothetical protein
VLKKFKYCAQQAPLKQVGKPEQTPCRGLLEGLSELVGDCKEATRNFILYSQFSAQTKRQPKIVKTISAHTKSTDLIFINLKN